VYRDLGNYNEAQKLNQRALAIREKVYEQTLKTEPPEPPMVTNYRLREIASSLNNLAAVYRNQGKYQEALPFATCARN
jgi:tetratricopeptide (TPR) repeat protein